MVADVPALARALKKRGAHYDVVVSLWRPPRIWRPRATPRLVDVPGWEVGIHLWDIDGLGGARAEPLATIVTVDGQVFPRDTDPSVTVSHLQSPNSMSAIADALRSIAKRDGISI